MNYYNPYFSAYPYMQATSKIGLFSKIFGSNFNFSSIISGTGKTLNVINQAIPLVKQATPVLKNAKTMFKVLNEFKKVDTPKVRNKNYTKFNTKKEEINSSNQTYEQPTFFV